ncbi:MAG: hypothetical protein CTY16_16005 [Methylobacter sp.]|nr:MAG: hypothetical protein CTY16_16005 [Methylobacter sp.]
MRINMGGKGLLDWGLREIHFKNGRVRAIRQWVAILTEYRNPVAKICLEGLRFSRSHGVA